MKTLLLTTSAAALALAACQSEPAAEPEADPVEEVVPVDPMGTDAMIDGSMADGTATGETMPEDGTGDDMMMPPEEQPQDGVVPPPGG